MKDSLSLRLWLRIVRWAEKRYSVPCSLCRRPIWRFFQERRTDGTFNWHIPCANEQPTMRVVDPPGEVVTGHIQGFNANPALEMKPDHREKFHKIFGDAIIVNESDVTVHLEGAVFKRLTLAPGQRHRLGGPVLDPRIGPNGKIMFTQYDPLFILQDMILTHENRHLRTLTSEADIIAGSKLKAFRARGKKGK